MHNNNHDNVDRRPLSSSDYRLYTYILIVTSLMAVIVNIYLGFEAVITPLSQISNTQVSMLHELTAQIH